MSDKIANDIAAVRAKLMEDLASIIVFSAAVDKSPRTIQRMIAKQEIPTVMIGRTPFVVVSRAREAFMSSTATLHAPVRRGRPSKKAAA